MAECKIDEGVEEFRSETGDEQDAMSYLYMKHMAKHLEDATEKGQSAFGKGDKYWKWFRFDRASVTDMSASKITRGLSNILYEGLGRKGKDWVRAKTMTQHKTFELNKIRTQYYKAWTTQYDAWLKEKGYKGLSKHGLAKRVEFNEEVSNVIRGGTSDSKAVNNMANSQAERYKQLLQNAKSAGVKGADDIEANFNYLTRIWSAGKIQKLVDKFTHERVVNFLTSAMRGGINEKSNRKIAEYILDVVRYGKPNATINISRIFNSKAADLDSLLKNTTDLEQTKIDEIIKALFPTGSGGTNKYFRSRRVKLDETYSDGQMKVSDFLENDSEVLFLNYANTMTGQIALAQRGFRSKQDWDVMMSNINKEWDNIRRNDPSLYNKNAVDNERQALQSGYDWLVGKPLEEGYDTGFGTFARIMRKYNFSRIMNQVGFAQIAEIGVLVANVGLRQTIKHVPEMRKLLKRAKNGDVDDEFIREAEVMFGGFGSERLINQVANQTDEFGSRIGTTKWRGVEQGLDRLNRFTADISGMHLVNQAMKRIAIKGIMQRYLDEAFGKGKVMSKARLRDIGISDEMHDRILKQLREHSDFFEGAFTKRKIRKMNLDSWVDQDAAATLAMSMNRWGRRTIQENDIGEMFYRIPGKGIFGVDSTFGKIMYQFRGFMMTAYTKHLLHGIKMNDFQAYMGFITSMFFASMAGYAQIQAQMALMGRKERKEYWEKRFGKTDADFWKSMAKMGFQRSAFASLLPAFMDTGMQVFGGDPLFHYRSTGLDSNLMTGNPTYDAIWNKAIKGASKTFKSFWDEDYEFSQSQYNKLTQLLILQNALGIQNVIRKFGEVNLPEKP